MENDKYIGTIIKKPDYDEVYTDYFEGDIFIIPNNLRKIKDFFSWATRSKLLNFIRDLRFVNSGIEISEDDYLVEVWYTNSVYNNLVDHGMRISLKDDPVVKIISPDFGYLPLSLLKDKKEGDEFKLWIPSHLDIYTNDDIKRQCAVIGLSVKCNQMSYRYRCFGPFEETIDTLTSFIKE